MQGASGYVQLTRLIIRRDRVYLPCWFIGLVFLSCFYVPEMQIFIGSGESVEVIIEMMQNPAMIAIMGAPFGKEIGPLYAQFMTVYTALAVGIFNIMFVIRHTRKDEEEGRIEIINSLPVGRAANLLAVFTVVLAADMLIALASTLMFVVLNIDGMGIFGGAVFSCAIASAGFVFAGLAAVYAQLSATSRNASAMSFYTLGISFLIRAVGDVSCEALSRFSPLGLAQRAQPWVSNQLWPIVLMVTAALVFFAVAFVLNSRRDTGAGLIAERSGRRYASPFLRNELGLAFRLTRATCLAWILAMFVLGLMVGAIFNDMAGFFTTNELYRQLIGIGVADEETLIKTFIEFIMLIMTVLTAIPVCQVVLRCISEEHHGRTEQLYGLAVSRFRMLGSYWIISLGLAVVTQLTLALGVYVSALPTSDTPPQLSMLLSTTMCYVPALLVFSGLAVALCGLLPRASAAAWVFIAYNFLMQYLGNMLSLPEFARKLSPLEWVKPGSEPVAFVGVGLFGLFAAWVGLLAYRRRDLSG